MATLIGPIRFEGTIGDLTARRCGKKIIIQEKPGPTREQVLNSPGSEGTRRNAGEFGLAIKDSTLLRRALQGTLKGVHDMGLNGRMNKLLHRVSRTDTYSLYGYRHAGAGDLSLLTGYEFNPELLLDKALPMPFKHSLDVVTGAVRLELPSFIARRKKSYPKGATHCRIISCAAVVDFTHNSYANTIKPSELLPLGKKTSDAICLDHRLTVQPGEVLLQVMGMEFYTVEDGKQKLLKGGTMRILEAVQMPVIPMKEESEEVVVMQPVDGDVGPFTAKELKKMFGRNFKQMAGRNLETLRKHIRMDSPYGANLKPYTPFYKAAAPDGAKYKNPEGLFKL